MKSERVSIVMSGNLSCIRLDNPQTALGCAVRILRSGQPFRSNKFGAFTDAVVRQIKRGHYVLTVQDDMVFGYFGWAICSEEVAHAWLERRRAPTPETCEGDDCFIVETFYAKSREAAFFQTRHVRKLYPTVQVFCRRAKKGQPLRPVRLRNVMGEETAIPEETLT